MKDKKMLIRRKDTQRTGFSKKMVINMTFKFLKVIGVNGKK